MFTPLFVLFDLPDQMVIATVCLVQGRAQTAVMT